MDILAQINIDDLLLAKALTPLSQEQLATLEHVQNYPGVAAFNEAEVRSYIIDPILRVLGYDKGTHFSTRLENNLSFLGQNRRSDYQLTLWEENFWLIEAKRPRMGADHFSYDDFSQALEYSVHPAVNAALVVLCDGLKIEVFDREANIDTPILHVDIQSLTADFDKLRALLEPMQIWFFEKRRVLRLIDRVLDREFVMERAKEFAGIIERRIAGKRQRIVENFRNTVNPDHDDAQKRAEAAAIPDLTDIYMHFDYPIPIDSAVTRRLVDLSTPGTFKVMYALFPDGPRAATDTFMAQAGIYLMALQKTREAVEWAPTWLSPRSQTQARLGSMIRFYIDQCLTYFADSEPHRLVLLAANAFQRIAKISITLDAGTQQLGRELHALARFQIPEMTWEQVGSSPEKELISIMESNAYGALSNFVAKFGGIGERFKSESAKLALRAYWRFELKLLQSVPNYRKLLRERKLGDLRMIEGSAVTYDNLAHSFLCRLEPRFPEWAKYIAMEKKTELAKIAAMQSWAARDLIGVPRDAAIDAPSDEELASRFFLGDLQTLQSLRAAYDGAKQP